MGLSSGQLPHQPGIHSSEKQLPRTRPLPCSLHMVQNPLQLGGREIGVHQQASVLLNILCQRRVSLQLLAQGRGSPALPDNGVVYRTSRVFIPDHGGFPLVGDADGGHLLRGHSRLSQGLGENGKLSRPDLHRVLLHPAGLRIVLGQLPLGHPHDVLLPVKYNAPAAGGPLVQGDNVLFHRAPFSGSRPAEADSCFWMSPFYLIPLSGASSFPIWAERHLCPAVHRMSCGTAIFSSPAAAGPALNPIDLKECL